MKRTVLFVALAAVAAVSAPSSFAASFTYHGVLQDAGKPAQGKYDIELTLYASPNGGSVIGGPLALYGVDVNDGSFATEADFGPLAKSFKNAYVGVKVRSSGTGEFTPLGNLEAVVDTNSSCPGSWSLDGNAGNPSGSYLGTADTQPLVFKASGAQIVRSDLVGGGAIPRWLGGGSENGSSTGGQAGFIGNGGSNTDLSKRNQVGNFSAVVGGMQNSAGYSAANGFTFIGGGDTNTANVDYGVIDGGTSNTVSANYGTIGGGQGNAVTAVGGTVPGGQINFAGGVNSFAAGNGAVAAFANSFVWSDGSTQFGDSAAKQFDIQAAGGVAINGTPKNNATELTIYSPDYPNIFLGTEGKIGGILLSANPASSASANNAAFAIDLYDGTNQSRKFYVDNGGVIVNDPAGIPAGVSSGNVALSVVHSASITSSLLDMYGQTSDSSYYELSATDKFIVAQYIPGSAYNQRLIIAANGDLTVSANAFKPGGGSWSATSDRRIKQDVAPIRDAVDTIMKLRPVNFRYTPEYRAMEGGLEDKSYAGFIAQEYRDVFPEAVTQTSRRVPGAAASDPTILALDPNPAIITAVAAVQELATENAELHHQVDELSARLTRLEARKGN